MRSKHDQASKASLLSNTQLLKAHCIMSAIEATSCAVTDQNCICTNEPVLTNAIGCFGLQCTPKLSLCMSTYHSGGDSTNYGLASTNMTRASCGIPEESAANLTPALAGSLGMLALIMVALRWCQRIFIKKSLGWDDGLILMALVTVSHK